MHVCRLCVGGDASRVNGAGPRGARRRARCAATAGFFPAAGGRHRQAGARHVLCRHGRVRLPRGAQHERVLLGRARARRVRGVTPGERSLPHVRIMRISAAEVRSVRRVSIPRPPSVVPGLFLSAQVLNNTPLSYPADLWALGSVVFQVRADVAVSGLRRARAAAGREEVGVA